MPGGVALTSREYQANSNDKDPEPHGMRLAAISRPMRRLLVLLSSGLLLMGAGTESPLDVDPNTKIEGGADVRGSGANAGTDVRSDKKPDPEKEKSDPIARPEARGDEKDKPISERKPRERESEEASRGETRPPQQ